MALSAVIPPSPRQRPSWSDRRLRIAVLAPPWIPVPPPAYGGIEEVVDLLCEGLVSAGHSVTLFAAPGATLVGTPQDAPGGRSSG